MKRITNADKVKIIIKKRRPPVDFKQGQSVKLTIGERTELGYNALIDNTRKGDPL